MERRKQVHLVDYGTISLARLENGVIIIASIFEGQYLEEKGQNLWFKVKKEEEKDSWPGDRVEGEICHRILVGMRNDILMPNI